MRRPSDKHLNQDELNALAPSSSLGGGSRLSADAVLEAEHHLLECEDCEKKVSLYRQLLSQPSDAGKASSAGTDCPRNEDVDWHEVAAGLWPELKAKQLLMHAAQCDHCGPLLHAALCIDNDPTPDEEKFLAQLKTPSRPESVPVRTSGSRQWWQWQITRWAVPVAALIVIVGMLRSRPAPSPYALSGTQFAALAANTYMKQARGTLPLDTHADSQQALNEWFKANLQFAVTLPTTLPGTEQPFRVEGARLLPVSGKYSAAYIAYVMRTGPVGLMVVPDSVAVASGGAVADFKKVSFHYSMVQGYKLVTWTIHGLTYGLVSREGNQTQTSCMVCHSAMGDRDLSYTPTPFRDKGHRFQTLWQ